MIPNFILLQSENVFCVIQMFLNLLKLNLRPRIWTILANALYTLENDECPAVVWQSVSLKVSWVDPVDSAVQGIDILSSFLFTFSINY